jgi:hypothetical protein
MFADDLKAKGWTELSKDWEFTKGDWKIDFDTGHWMIVSTRSNPRVFDVSAPQDYESRWTVSLIEHLCRMEDERVRLRTALAEIRDSPTSNEPARSMAGEALEQCYHSWLINVKIPENEIGRAYCSICGKTATEQQAGAGR